MINQSQFQQLHQEIRKLPPEQRNIVYRRIFRDPRYLPFFSLLFPNHIPKFPPDFHREIYDFISPLDRNKGLAAPRGFAKSTLINNIFTPYICLNGMKKFGLVISDTATQAQMHLASIKAELESNEMIREIYGEPVGSEWQENSIIVNGLDVHGNRTETKIIAVGAGMKVRGLRFKSFRPDFVIVDDLENDELVASVDRRQKLRNWFRKALLPALSKSGVIILIGTVLHNDSLLKNILDQKDEFAGWDVRKYQALDENSESTFPELYSSDDVVRMRDDPSYEKYLGPLAFSQEMMNEPVPEEDQVFKPEWLNQTYNLEEELAAFRIGRVDLMQPEVTHDIILATWLKEKFEEVVAAVDPAISEKTSADYWAMVTVGVERGTGHHWILDVVRMREGDITKQAQQVIDQYMMWKHDRIKVETVAYQRGLYQLIMTEGAKQHAYPPIVAFIPDKDKRRRGIIHSSKFAGGLVHLRQDHALYSAFREETIQFTGKGDAHDDMIDAYMAATEHTVLQRKIRTFTSKPAGW